MSWIRRWRDWALKTWFLYFCRHLVEKCVPAWGLRVAKGGGQPWLPFRLALGQPLASLGWATWWPSQTFFFWIWTLFGLNLDTLKGYRDAIFFVRILSPRSRYLDYRGYQIPWFSIVLNKSFKKNENSDETLLVLDVFGELEAHTRGEKISPRPFCTISHPQNH